jgi:beta-1,2-xylosyltransferase
MMTKDVSWRDSHRVRLHRFANNMTDDVFEYIVPDLGQWDQPEGAQQSRRSTLGYQIESRPRDVVLDHFFDLKLTGNAMQCDEEDGTCEAME